MTRQISEPRPLVLQREVERRYPGIWEIVSGMRKSKGCAKYLLKDWEDWCYLPLSVWYSIAQGVTEEPDTRVPWIKANLIAAVGTWRLGKGIYRFDKDLYEELISTRISDNLPVEIFFRLPEYCIYIETPGVTHRNTEIHGFFALLNDDRMGGCPTLRLVYDGGLGKAYPVELKIPKDGDFKTEFEKIYFNEKNIAAALAKGTGTTKENILYDMRLLRELAIKTLPLLLYLCSDEPDYGDKTPPVYAMPKKVKTGLKWFSATGIKNWDIGVRIGATIRKYRQQAAERESFETGRGRAPVRPHMRNAHWHGFWTGKRSEPLKRKYILHWIPSISVNMHDADAPAVIRPVKK